LNPESIFFVLRILPIFFVVGISLALVPDVLVMETVGRVE